MKQRDTLMRDLNRAGLRLDDAAIAAGIACQRMIDLRNRLMVRARALDMSLRDISEMFGTTLSYTHRIVSGATPEAIEPIEPVEDRGDMLARRLTALLAEFGSITAFPAEDAKGTDSQQTLPRTPTSRRVSAMTLAR